VKVTLNDSVFNGSYGMKHFADLALQILQRASPRQSLGRDTQTITSLRQLLDRPSNQREAFLKYVPEVVFILHDGGHDHNNSLLQNIAALLALFELLQLHVCVNNRNAPDGSWVNSI
jgi:hypothetical protein